MTDRGQADAKNIENKNKKKLTGIDTKKDFNYSRLETTLNQYNCQLFLVSFQLSF